MAQASLINPTLYSNILYIGDEPKACLSVIEKFNSRLAVIEHAYKGWFTTVNTSIPQKLQHHIQYHFEGGVAVFKFRNEGELPHAIRKACLQACRNLAAEQSLAFS